jgi:hypothetical protein
MNSNAGTVIVTKPALNDEVTITAHGNYGGAIYNEEADLTITNSTFTGNDGIYRETWGRTGEPVSHIVTTSAQIGPSGTIIPAPWGAERYISPSGTVVSREWSCEFERNLYRWYKIGISS